MNDLDLIIASTALAKEITLLTKDRDFESILERLDVKFI
jgi:predicted nucleic acid-binding protein